MGSFRDLGGGVVWIQWAACEVDTSAGCPELGEDDGGIADGFVVICT